MVARTKRREVDDIFEGGRTESSVSQHSLLNVIESYLRFYAMGKGHTARAKQLDLKAFLRFLAQLRGRTSPQKLFVRDWDLSATQRFVDGQIQLGEAPATVARRLATLKHLGGTLAAKVPGFTNPARDVKPPRVEIAKPKALSADEVRRIKAQAKEWSATRKSYRAVRDEMIVNMLLETGLRADEIRLMRREQIPEELDWIASVRTKGRRFRNVYIPSSLRPMLRNYLVARDSELKRFFAERRASVDGKLPLFVSPYAAKATKPDSFFMGPKTLWRVVNRLSEELSIHPHLLRHTFALELLDHSGDIRLVSQALGHGDVKVTMRYTERRGEEVARALESMKRNKSK